MGCSNSFYLCATGRGDWAVVRICTCVLQVGEAGL